MPWRPAGDVAAAAVHRIRSAATGRAHDVVLDLHVEGPVALWSHPVAPTLATTALVAPERMLERAQTAGLGSADMHVVVAPHRPVACAGDCSFQIAARDRARHDVSTQQRAGLRAHRLTRQGVRALGSQTLQRLIGGGEQRVGTDAVQ